VCTWVSLDILSTPFLNKIYEDKWKGILPSINGVKSTKDTTRDYIVIKEYENIVIRGCQVQCSVEINPASHLEPLSQPPTPDVTQQA